MREEIEVETNVEKNLHTYGIDFLEFRIIYQINESRQVGFNIEFRVVKYRNLKRDRNVVSKISKNSKHCFIKTLNSP